MKLKKIFNSIKIFNGVKLKKILLKLHLIKKKTLLNRLKVNSKKSWQRAWSKVIVIGRKALRPRLLTKPVALTTNHRLRPIFIAVILILVILGIYLLFFSSSEALAEWWDINWHYRKAITISNSGSTQTNTQVKILSAYDLSADVTAGKVQADLDDLRFTDINGAEIKYWIEDSTNTSVDVWGFLPSAPASGATIYMYYGNPNASAGKSTVGTSTYPGVSCKAIKLSGVSTDGAYYIDPTGEESSDKFQAYCDMTTDNGGWTIFAVINTADISMVNTDDATDHVLTYDGKFSNNAYAPTSYSQTESSNIALTKLIDAGESIDFMRYDITDNIIGINYGTIYSSSSRSIGGECGDDFPAHTDFVTYGHRYPGIGSKHGWQGGTSPQIYTGYSGSTPADSEGCKYFGSATYNTGHYKMFYGVRNVVPNTDNISATLQSEEKSPGPVAYWSFDEGYGTTTQDRTTNNNDGTITGALWQTEDMCISGKCLWFDGTNDQVEISNDPALQFGTDSYSFSLWLKLNALEGTSDGIFEKGGINDGVAGFRLSLANVDDLNITTGDGINRVHSQAANAATFGEWFHLGIVVDRVNDVVKFYKNGVALTVTNSNISSVTGSTSNSGGMHIGWGDNLETNNFMHGFIDEVKIYSYARTPSQIKADYNARGGASSKGTAVSLGRPSSNSEAFSEGLVGYWKMDESSGTSVADASGNGNTGTATDDDPTDATCLDGDTPPPAAAGKYSNSRDFDGCDDYVDISMNSGGTSYSLGSWIKPNSMTDYGMILQGSGHSYHNFMVKNTVLYNGHYCGDSVWNNYSKSYSFTAGQWYHVMAVFDADKGHTLYVNGESIGSSTNTNLPASNAFYNIGGRATYDDAFFNGSLDEVRIYNRALSAREVRHLYEYAPGPVGHWKMDEASWSGVSGEVKDSSGNGNNGTRSGDATTTTPGKYGKAGTFDNSGDYITVSSPSSIPIGNQNYTITAWIKPDTCGNKGIVGWGNYLTTNQVNAFRLIDESGNCRLRSYWWGNDFSSTNNVTLGQWNFVSTSFDGTTRRHYINGIEAGSDTPTGHNVPDASNLTLAKTYSAEYFDGLIDDVRIYNYARTQKQILEDMNAGRPAQKSPVAYWKFDEGYGTSAKDSSEYGNNGTITGATWTNAGKFNKALSFNGSSTYVDVGQPSSLNIGKNSFTASAWFKVDSTRGRLITNGASSWSNGFGLIVSHENVGDVTFHLGAGGIQANSLLLGTTDTSFNDNAWHFAQGVLKYGDYAAIYVDGKIKAMNQRSGTCGSLIENNTKLDVSSCTNLDASHAVNFNIGRYPGAQYVNGLIDEVKIFNYALTQDEIKAEYNRGVIGKIGSPTSNDSSTAQYCVPGSSESCNPPVAEWKFEEHSGTYAYDTSGNGNTGTLTNMEESDWTVGEIGGALNFDGTNEYVDLSSPASLAVANTTIEVWIKPSSISGYYLIYGLGNNPKLYINPSGKLELYNAAAANTVLTPNVWTHVAVTSDGTNVRYYVNAVSDGTVAHASWSTTPSQVKIGQDPVGSTQNFPGLIDQVRIYDYARTPAQIAWDYNKGKPVAHYKFDKGQGPTLFDSSGNGNNGTITPGTLGQTSVGSVKINANTMWYNGLNGKMNYSLNFDGSDDKIALPASLAGLGTGTISAWINVPNGTNNRGAMLGWGDGGTTNWGTFEIGPSTGSYDNEFMTYVNLGANTLSMMLRDSDTNNSYLLEDGTWHHLVAVVDGVENTIYLDGIKQTITYQQGSSTTANAFLNTGSNTILRIGDSTYNGGHIPFDGQIDDVKIYNYALTADQIKTVYNMGAARLGTGD